MKVSFFHDSILKHDSISGTFYTSGGLTYSYLKRYLKYFDDILMVTRSEEIKEKEDKSKLSVSSGKHVAFDCVNSTGVKALVSGSTKNKVTESLKNTDFAVIRLPSIIGIIACRKCNKLKKPYLVEVVGSPFCSLWYYGKLGYKLVAPFYAAINRHLIKKADNVIYVTRKYLQHSYPNRHNNIGVSDVNIEHFDEEVLEKRKKRIMSYSDQTVYKIGLIGSMDVKYKGHDVAIKSVPILKRNGINVEMHFLGKCSATSKEKLICMADKYGVSGAIFIDGVLPGGRAVYEWIDDKDFIILPSKMEGLPRSIIEAMSRAAICVGTRAGGISELLSNDCMMKKRNGVQLAHIIRRIANNKKMALEISENNFKGSKDYSRAVLSKETDDFYENMLLNKGKEQ